LNENLSPAGHLLRRLYYQRVPSTPLPRTIGSQIR